MTQKININQVVALLEEVANTVTDDHLAAKLQRVKENCSASKILKWKVLSDKKKREHKIYLHVYYGVDSSNVDKERVLAFYVNSRKQAKFFSTLVNSVSTSETHFEPALSVLLGNKVDKKHQTLIKELKNLHFFYKYPITKNKFRYVYFKDIKTCVETVARVCEKKNYKIVYSNIHNIKHIL
uniref:ORF30 n=1 Tax=Cydia pomonella granulosis virus TaxID=28289 RepID=A0A5B8H8V9_GVCP|nr:ORF30 [Cydia pomonella granulovirus]